MKKRGGKWLINDNDRQEFVSNHYPLYIKWCHSGKGITTWVRQHRQEIDEIYIAMLDAEPRR